MSKFIAFDQSSLDLDINEIRWKRPKEIMEDPALFKKENISDPCQGELGDCWLISACLAVKKLGLPETLFSAIPDFMSKRTVSIKVRLFFPPYGWKEIEVDDYLPTIDNKLLFATCSHQNQLWVAYIEKACAKYFGCYEALNGGQVSEGFTLLTGGYCLRYSFKFSPNSFSLMNKILDKNNLAACVSFEKKGCPEKVLEDHYYLIDISTTASSRNSVIKLTNLQRNSYESSSISIPIEDLQRCNFTVTVMMTDPKVMANDDMAWTDHCIESSWKCMESCGGKYEPMKFNFSSSSSSSLKFSDNPQYCLAFDDFGKPSLVHVTLVQQSKRKHARGKRLQQAIGVHVWKIKRDRPVRKIKGEVLMQNRAWKCANPEYSFMADVLMLLSTDENLLFVPSTHQSDVNLDFFIRIATNRPSTLTTLR